MCVVKGAGHACSLTHPNVVNPVLIDFLRRATWDHDEDDDREVWDEERWKAAAEGSGGGGGGGGGETTATIPPGDVGPVVNPLRAIGRVVALKSSANRRLPATASGKEPHHIVRRWDAAPPRTSASGET